MKYYFTKSYMATKKEASEAKRHGCVLVNGMYGDTFDRDCEAVYGEFPEHLKHKAKRKTVNKQAINKVEQPNKESAEQ